MRGVAVAGDVPALVHGQRQEGEMGPGAVVAQTLFGAAVRVPQRLRAEPTGLEATSHGGDVLVAALVRCSPDGKRFCVQTKLLDGTRCYQGLCLKRLLT